MTRCRTRILLLLLLILGIAGALFYQTCGAPYTWKKVFTCYGFSTPEQKKAFENLLEKASIEKEALSQGMSFSCEKKQKQMLSAIIALVKDTQAKFTVRKGNQERWDVQPLDWMEQDKATLATDLATLGFVRPVIPHMTYADAVCILGATLGRMTQRMTFVEELMEQGLHTHHIVLLAGERYVTVGVDGPEERLRQLARQKDLLDVNQLTEAHLAQFAYDASPLSKRSLTVHLINTPKRDLPRPTTQTTILELIAWLKDHPEIKSMLFVSNQPHVHYQEAIIRSLLHQEKVQLAFEVIGPGVEDSTNTKAMIEALGSYLWASTPYILTQLKITSSNNQDKAALRDLYAATPAIAKGIPPSLLST